MAQTQTTHIIVATHQEIDEAIAAHSSPEGVLLCLPDHAIKTMGMGMISGFQKHIEENHPLWKEHLAVDCGDNAGQALSALRHGMKHIFFSGPDTSLLKLQELQRKWMRRL